MKSEALIKKIFARPALAGAALTVVCGLLLLTPLGEAWENASYDCLFRFGARAVTNQVVLIKMDNAACRALGQTRAHWNRALHAQLLNQLTEAGCPLAVFDVLFDEKRDEPTDAMLADAMGRHGRVVLVASSEKPENPGTKIFEGVLPHPQFLDAATNWGVGKLNGSDAATVRRHWPFPAPQSGYPGLAWTAAQLAHVSTRKLPPEQQPQEQWLRYYGPHGGWDAFSYHLALDRLSNAPDYFRGRIVFIGNQPDLSDTNSRADTFRTPYGEEVGGMEIHATTFLNLVNGGWLRRLPAWSEVLLLALTGILIGGGLSRLKPWWSLPVAMGIFLVVMLAFVTWSYYGNHWFPWLVIAGGQVPCALAVSFVAWLAAKPRGELSRYPGYEAVGKKFGAGAFGEVQLVRDQAGHLRAVKEVNLKKLKGVREAYDREFHGLQTYMPISDKHFELLQVKFVRRFDDQGYFFYVMELSDPLDAKWDRQSPFEPFSLDNHCHKRGGQLTTSECLNVGIVLAEALVILHDEANLVHRDIKPANVVYVNGRPKLADVGLVREPIRDGESATIVFTPGFEDPLGLGTKLADLYALAITLYVISTGNGAKDFPKLSTTLVENPEFIHLNEIICKATRHAADQRYATADEMLAALRKAGSDLDGGHTKKM